MKKAKLFFQDLFSPLADLPSPPTDGKLEAGDVEKQLVRCLPQDYREGTTLSAFPVVYEPFPSSCSEGLK
jgi:hypothetical protein